MGSRRDGDSIVRVRHSRHQLAVPPENVHRYRATADHLVHPEFRPGLSSRRAAKADPPI
jgi:hypothetical protein